MTSPAAELSGRDLFRHPLSAAVAAVWRERGYAAASIEEIAARAGLEPAEIEARFAGKDELALAVVEACIDDYEARTASAFGQGGRWPGSLRAAAYETARWVREHRDATWVTLVGVMEAGEMARVRREALAQWCAGLIDAGREVAPDPAAIPPAAAVLAVGSIVEGLGRALRRDIGTGVVEPLRWSMYVAVRPYLGEEAARAELETPLPPDLAGLDP